MKHTIHNQVTLHPTATEPDRNFYHPELSCKPRAEGTCSLRRGAAESLVQSTNHLGSASWITDANGTPIQHIQYCPYGEPFVDQHPANIYQERVIFTGKERDEETGYHYFGARYLDADLMTGWLSVDPMSDKYPSLSPYNYCAWNPLKLVDPEGEVILEITDDPPNKTRQAPAINSDINNVKSPNKAQDNGLTKRDIVIWISNAEQKLVDAIEPIAVSLSSLMPLISEGNNISILVKGEDVYGNKADTPKDKVLAAVNMVTGGAAKLTAKCMKKSSEIINNIISAYSAVETYEKEKGKKKK